jgi:hypothetical protein
MEHEDSSAISFDSSYTRTNNIYFQSFVQNTGNYIFFCKLQLGQKVILDLIGKMLGPSSMGMVDCLVSFCRYVYCSYFKRRTVREFILGVLLYLLL